MQTAGKALLFIVLAGLSGQVLAQVYKTQDAEGRPRYEGVPSEGAVKVEVPPVNLADSVEPRPQETPETETRKSEAPPERGTPEFEEKIARELEAYRREVAEQRRERDSGKRHVVGHDGSEKRNEVGSKQ